MSPKLCNSQNGEKMFEFPADNFFQKVKRILVLQNEINLHLVPYIFIVRAVLEKFRLYSNEFSHIAEV